MNLVGFKKLAEYSQVKQNIANSAVSPYTGTAQLSEEEWHEFHTDLLHLDLPIPQSTCDDREMAVIVDTFLHHAKYASPHGDVPLCQLSLLPPPRCGSPLSPLVCDLSLSNLVSLSPSYKAPVFLDDFKHADLQSHRPEVKRAPSSSSSICSRPEPVLHIFQPQPKREIEIDLLELEAMAAEGEAEFVQTSKEHDETFWRSWLDRCLENVERNVLEHC